jgi:hypothetical protein
VNELKHNRIPTTTNEKTGQLEWESSFTSFEVHRLQWEEPRENGRMKKREKELVAAKWRDRKRESGSAEEDTSDEMKERQQHTYRRIKLRKTVSSVGRHTQAK